jgi:IS5 family transposase
MSQGILELDDNGFNVLEGTAAKFDNSRDWDELLHAEEKSILADKGYDNAEREATFKKCGRTLGFMLEAQRGGKGYPIEEEINRIIAMARTNVEYPFLFIKRRLILLIMRHRALAENRVNLFTLFALRSLFVVEERLME